MEGRRIERLADEVVARIAAGEVVQRPASVVKELLENAVDAGATSVCVVVAVGHKSIIVQDNGGGIAHADLPLVCERHATSKLSQFDDLQSMATYGFRGEALASVSRVAHVTITSKTRAATCAYKVEYLDGKLVGEPRACAANEGTVVCVEDLFYNMPTRRASVRADSDEHAKMVQVVTHYAVHRANVGFTLKRQGATASADVRTPAGSTARQNIALLFGAALAKDLIAVSDEDSSLDYRLSDGYISHPSYTLRKFTLLLFINERMVRCQPMRRALDLLFSGYLPKGSHPFVYLSVQLPPSRVDVNVHPAKEEVRFLNETQIIERILEVMEARLIESSERRRVDAHGSQSPFGSTVAASQTPPQRNAAASARKRAYDHELVRTDHREQRLDVWLTSPAPADELPSTPSTQPARAIEAACSTAETTNDALPANSWPPVVERVACVPAEASAESESDVHHEVVVLYEADATRPLWRDLRLQSLDGLRSAVCDAACRQTRRLFAEHCFVGCASPSQALIQYSTNLYIVNVENVCYELFYQMVLFRFGNLGSLQLAAPVSLAHLYRAGGGSGEAAAVVALLAPHAPMLLDYFAVHIEGDELLAVPMVLSEYTPQMEGLPALVTELVDGVDWTSERACLRSVSRALARFCAPKAAFCVGARFSRFQHTTWRQVFAQILFPTIKGKLLPPKCFSTDAQTLAMLTRLQDLYKIFERC